MQLSDTRPEKVSGRLLSDQEEDAIIGGEDDLSINRQFLPLGTVVALRDCAKRMMITGRLQKDVRTGEIYEYCAVPWPEGMISARKTFMFNKSAIVRLIFVGLQDEEEFEFSTLIEQAWPQILKESAAA